MSDTDYVEALLAGRAVLETRAEKLLAAELQEARAQAEAADTHSVNVVREYEEHRKRDALDSAERAELKRYREREALVQALLECIRRGDDFEGIDLAATDARNFKVKP